MVVLIDVQDTSNEENNHYYVLGFDEVDNIVFTIGGCILLIIVVSMFIYTIYDVCTRYII